jgi:CheY-like chemotaxis protein
MIPSRAAALAKILIIDDDHSVQLTIRLLLERAGHAVVTAGGGRKGLDLVEQEDFDLLFSIFSCRHGWLRNHAPASATATVDACHRDLGPPLPADPADGPDFLAMARKLGAIRSLQKPFRPAELLTAVAACLEAANRPSSVATGDIASGR